jgi:hypothetical protein
MMSKKQFLKGIVSRKSKEERLKFINLVRNKLEFEKHNFDLTQYQNYLKKINYYDYMITNNKPIEIDKIQTYKTPTLDQFFN